MASEAQEAIDRVWLTASADWSQRAGGTTRCHGTVPAGYTSVVGSTGVGAAPDTALDTALS